MRHDRIDYYALQLNRLQSTKQLHFTWINYGHKLPNIDDTFSDYDCAVKSSITFNIVTSCCALLYTLWISDTKLLFAQQIGSHLYPPFDTLYFS